MLRLFRNSREDIVSERKARRYLNYAIGELILVVFGILIALQVNNWNNEYCPVKQLESFSFPDSLLHDAHKDTNLSLLTDNMKDIKVGVNSYLVLGSSYGIRPRAEVEMPKLAAVAR